MEVVLLDIVQSNHCYYDPHAECEKDIEEPDEMICRNCVSKTHVSTFQRSEDGG